MSPGGLKKTVLFVACGSFHLLVVAREPNQLQSILFLSGLNQFGQLGIGVEGEGEAAAGVDRHELTQVTALKDVNVGQVAAGMHHSMCLNLTGSEVYTWGRKDYGQLGHSEAKADFGEFTSTPTLVKFPALEGSKVHLFTDIACGDHTSMVLTFDHDLYTWGFDSTTGHGGRFNKEDLLRPRKLIINDRLQPKGDASTAVVYEVFSGGQHSALLVRRFAGSGN